MQSIGFSRTLVMMAILLLMAGCSTGGGNRAGLGGADGRDGSAPPPVRDSSTNAESDGVRVSGAGAGSTSSSGSSQRQVDSRSARQADQRVPDVTTIYFDFNRDSIKPEYQSVVVAHARYLRTNPGASVILKGHTDEQGTREYNLALGERRANAVKRFLALQGVSNSQVGVVSYGEERLQVRGNAESAHARNRRVEFTY